MQNLRHEMGNRTALDDEGYLGGVELRFRVVGGMPVDFHGGEVLDCGGVFVDG